MIFLLLQLSVQFYVKNFTDDLYMTDASDNNKRLIKPGYEENRMDFISVVKGNGGLIIRSAFNDEVWGFGVDDLLGYVPVTGSPDQMFSFVMVGPKTYFIRNTGFCIEYIPEFHVYKAMVCTGNDYQKFVVITKEDEDIAYTIGGITDKYYDELDKHAYHSHGDEIINGNFDYDGHSRHNHGSHNHSGHGHSGHNHSGHNHSGHNHSGHSSHIHDGHSGHGPYYSYGHSLGHSDSPAHSYSYSSSNPQPFFHSHGYTKDHSKDYIGDTFGDLINFNNTHNDNYPGYNDNYHGYNDNYHGYNDNYHDYNDPYPGYNDNYHGYNDNNVIGDYGNNPYNSSGYLYGGLGSLGRNYYSYNNGGIFGSNLGDYYDIHNTSYDNDNLYEPNNGHHMHGGIYNHGLDGLSI